MIDRDLASRLRSASRRFPAITLTGPRQSGKSTLCRTVFPHLPIANLEAPDVRAFAQEDPRGFLAQHGDGAILDEIQRCPHLLSYLQGRIDDDPRPGRWILTGSQNLALLESVSQSLAGRTAVLHLLPLSRNEVRRFRRHPKSLDDALVTGGYPRILDRRLPPDQWLAAYVATYIERDVRSISNVGDLVLFQRFLALCAGRTAQLLNLSSLATECGIAQPTARQWLSVLEASFLVFRLPPFSANVSKRLVKMPKLHFCDSGLVCWLLGIRNAAHLRSHPLRGAIFESWVVSEIAKHRAHRGELGGLFYYRDQHGTEVDLVVELPRGVMLVEAKAGQTASGEQLDAPRRVRDILAPRTRRPPCVVFGGAARQDRTDGLFLPWNEVDAHKWH